LRANAQNFAGEESYQLSAVSYQQSEANDIGSEHDE
jgi:hypothetical protein